MSISRGSDPETGRRGIDIVYRWDPRFGRGYDARVRLYENGTLVGQIRFLKGWDEAPAFFRTAATGTAHSLWAVGDLLDRSNHVVAGSSARSVTVRWNVTVQPGQVVP